MIFTPQQEEFIKYYFDPKSDTYSNITQSGIKAGFDKKYSENLNNIKPKWFTDAIEFYGDSEFLKEIDNELKNIAKLECYDANKGETNPQLLKIKQDTLKFLAERLNKAKYSTRQEITGANGADIKISFDENFKGRE